MENLYLYLYLSIFSFGMRTLVGVVSFGEKNCGAGANPRYFLINNESQ